MKSLNRLSLKNIFLLILLLFPFYGISAQNSLQKDADWPVLSKSCWPMSYGNPQANGRTNVIGPKSNNIKWQINKPYGTSSGPVISSTNTLYFGSDWNLHFYAMSTDTVVKWSFNGNKVNFLLGGMIVDRDENICFGSSDKYFYKFDKNGNVIWKYKTDGQINSFMPNIGLDSILYFASSDKYLYALKPDGTLKWKINKGSGFAYGNPALSPDYKTIYICGTDSSLYALNLDGSVKWNYPYKGNSYLPLVDSEGNVIIVLTGSDFTGTILSISSEGVLRWKYDFENEAGPSQYTAPCMDYNGNLFIATRQKLYSFDYNGHLRWKKDITPDPVGIDCPLACDAEGKIYFGSTLGTYYYCYANDGSQMWNIPLNGYSADKAPAFGPDGTLYIGVNNGDQKLSMIAVGQKLSSVEKDNGTLASFELSQNYPNPFNPLTVINYSLPGAAYVTLKIYDLLGKEAASIVNEYKSSGRYSVQFDASNLPSGTYIYELRANDFIKTSKMMLLK